MKACDEKYAEYYRENAHRLPGLRPPKDCPDTPAIPTYIVEPTVGQMAENFVGAVSQWSKAGFPVVSEEVWRARAAVCEGCEYWDGAARFGLGKCRHKKCGCTRFKRFLATEKCPLGKWPV